MSKEVICNKCKVVLVPKKITLIYLGREISHEFPTCPVCGNMYIPEDVVTNKMNQIEMKFEDK